MQPLTMEPAPALGGPLPSIFESASSCVLSILAPIAAAGLLPTPGTGIIEYKIGVKWTYHGVYLNDLSMLAYMALLTLPNHNVLGYFSGYTLLDLPSQRTVFTMWEAG